MKKILFCLLCLAVCLPVTAQKKGSKRATASTEWESVPLVQEGQVSGLAVAPTFKKDGFERYWGWVMSRMQYPPEAEARKVEGRVTMRVIVEPDGSVTLGEVLESPDQVLTDAVKATVAASPKWKPGAMLDPETGQQMPVRVMYTLSVEFKVRPQTKEPYQYRWRSQDEVRPYGSN